ncbi:chemotaxis protein CheX [Clostridium sp. SYSU_GA19001]|uniref:chemotaxis protein CheX n=1 Tax=Clostridium caldaquaticum TaxID=2940653 RepID=UPI00207754BD|nr:chemotaxis protein CheX [Clostridium caldaquaticum]MCM8711358.1 chemotaxis protein CheX [Clostridium caldaquaticum]
MNIKNSLIESMVEMFQMFGLNISFKEDKYQNHQFLGEQVNVLVGLTDGLTGNVIIGFKKSIALTIVSAMMGGMQIEELDFMAKSALGELANMALGSAIMKLKSDKIISLSPPTVLVGEEMSLTVSGSKSTRLTFGLNEDLFNIIVSIE